MDFSSLRILHIICFLQSCSCPLTNREYTGDFNPSKEPSLFWHIPDKNVFPLESIFSPTNVSNACLLLLADNFWNSTSLAVSNFPRQRASKDIQKEVDHISDSVSALSSKYPDTKKDMSKAAQDSISQIKENLEKKYKDEVAKHSEDLTKELTKTLEESRKEMEQKYNERLKLDVSEAAKAIIEEADNVIARVKVNSAQYLKEVVAKRVESERNGKLANLNALGERVKQIEKQELELSSAAETMIGFRKINSSLDAIRNILYSNTPSEKCGQELVKQINALKNLTKPLKNDVINSALSSLPSDRTLLKTGGVLTQSQLISRWESLTPEIRKVSLAPPNSGVLGQISSFLFSKLLVQKSGVPEKSDDSIAGSDVESVLARVNDDLVKNNLDSAVEEVANMKGWPRRLANDWLEESRKKLELQFLVEVIDTEIRVIS